MTDSLEILLAPYQDCLSTYRKLKLRPSEQDCTILLTKFVKTISLKPTNAGHVLKTVYFLIEKINELENILNLITTNIEKCFRALLREISTSYIIDSSTIDLFSGTLKLMHMFLRNHANNNSNISTNIYAIGESIYGLMWRYIIKIKADQIKIIQAKVRALNFCIFPPHFTISRYFVYHFSSVYKTLMDENNEEMKDKISQVLVSQSLKWLQIQQFSLETIKTLLLSNSNFIFLVLGQFLIAFGLKEKPVSGKILLKNFLREVTHSEIKPTLLSISLVSILIKLYSAENIDFVPGLCTEITTILRSVPDLDPCPFYPHIYQFVSILLRETWVLLEKQTHSQKTLCFTWMLQILNIFSVNFAENFDDFCTNFADELEFTISVQSNIMRSAYQHLSSQECSLDEVQIFERAFTNCYRIIAKSVTLEPHFKNQPFDNYVIASIIRFHQITILAIKSHALEAGMRFMATSFETTSAFWGQTRCQSSSELINALELFAKQVQNLSDEELGKSLKGVKNVIQMLSLDYYLGTEKRNSEIFRMWIRAILVKSNIFNLTMFEILGEKYEISPKQSNLIMEHEKEVLLALSEPINISVVDKIMTGYSNGEAPFEAQISLDPSAPLLKIAYLYDVGEWNVALQELEAILDKLGGLFDEKVLSLATIQTYTLTHFWFGLISYQIGNNRELPLASNYTLIGTEPDSFNIPNIPHGFLVAMEYVYVLLRYFVEEISESFVKELEFVLKHLITFFHMFSNNFYLFLSLVSASIYLSEIHTDNFNFGILVLNAFSELSIENGFGSTFSSLNQIYKLLREKNVKPDSVNYSNIFNFSKSIILSNFLSKSIANDVENPDFECEVDSFTLRSLINMEREYFSLQTLDLSTDEQIIVNEHSTLIDLCKNFRKMASNLTSEMKTGKNRGQGKGFSFSILPSFLQRVYKLSQILIHSGDTMEATFYIDLGFQVSGKLCLFEWRLQFLILGIQLDILREKSEKVESYSEFISKTRNILLENDSELPENISIGFAFLLKSKKLKMNRSEFKNFLCITRKAKLVYSQMNLDNFNKILISTSKSIIDTDASPITKKDFTVFQESLIEIISNLHKLFSKVDSEEILNQSLIIERFPTNEHNFTTKICQMRLLTEKLNTPIGSKSAVSVYRTGLKLISGMESPNLSLNQPELCQSLAEFYLKAGMAFESVHEKGDKQKSNLQFCLPTPQMDATNELIEIYTSCLRATMPYGSVVILKDALSSLAEIHSAFDPTVSAVYFNAAFGLNLRHLSINKSQDKQSSFNLFCFNPITYLPHNSLQGNLNSSFENFPEEWTVLTISWPKKGEHLYISRLRSNKPALMIKIPITPISYFNFGENKNDCKSHEEVLANIFALLRETIKTEAKLNNAKWWESKSRANTALCEALTRMEQDWLSVWKGVFLGRLQIGREFLAKITNELVEFVFKLTNVPSIEREYVTELMELLLESLPLLKQSLLGNILLQTFPSLTENEIETVVRLICRKSEDLYEELADVLDKFECTPITVPRGHIFLILDPHLHGIPWENFPTLSTQSISRVPSLHFLFFLTEKYLSKSRIDISNGFYVLNPQGDLVKCEKDFKALFSSLKWQGVAGKPPLELVDSVSAKDLYVYCGHGSGSEYINKDKLLNSEGRAFTMLMGCSTSKLTLDGAFEYPNMLLLLLLAGYPTVIGMLWFITDNELNLFTKKLIQEIVKVKDLKFSPSDFKQNTLFSAFQQARLSCKHRYVTGSAAVIYGLPLY